VIGVGPTRAAARERARHAARRRLSSTVETERRRIERDLHDGSRQRILARMLTLGLPADAPGNRRVRAVLTWLDAAHAG
jgi:signal transduction histidine kinase